MGRPAGDTLKTSIRRRTKRARRFVVALAARAALAFWGMFPFAVTSRLFPAVIGFFAYRMLRRDIDRNLDHAYDGALSAAEKARIGKRVARNTGLLVAELIAMIRGRLPADYIDDSEVRALDLDGGFIALSAHIGNWELLSREMRRRWPDVEASVIARRHSNPHINRLIERMRDAFGVATIYQDDSPRRTIRSLTEGKIVAIVPDQDVVRLAGTFVPFFGKPAWTPTGPAFLALMARAPIVPCFTRRTAKGLYLVCPGTIYPDPSAPREQEIERLTRAWSDAIERHIREQPADWMWFHKRWRTTPERLEQRRQRRTG